MSVTFLNTVRLWRERLRDYVHPDWQRALSPIGSCHDCGEPVQDRKLFCAYCEEPPIL